MGSLLKYVGMKPTVLDHGAFGMLIIGVQPIQNTVSEALHLMNQENGLIVPDNSSLAQWHGAQSIVSWNESTCWSTLCHPGWHCCGSNWWLPILGAVQEWPSGRVVMRMAHSRESFEDVRKTQVHVTEAHCRGTHSVQHVCQMKSVTMPSRPPQKHAAVNIVTGGTLCFMVVD